MNEEYAYLQAQIVAWAEAELTFEQRVGLTESDLRRRFSEAGAPGLDRLRRRALRTTLRRTKDGLHA